MEFDIFIEHGLKRELEICPVACRKEKWEIPLPYFSGHVYI